MCFDEHTSVIDLCHDPGVKANLMGNVAVAFDSHDVRWRDVRHLRHVNVAN